MSANRKKNQWNVTLQSPNGESTQYVFKAHWDPEKVSSEAIGKAAAIKAYHESGKTTEFQPIKVEAH